MCFWQIMKDKIHCVWSSFVRSPCKMSKAATFKMGNQPTIYQNILWEGGGGRWANNCWNYCAIQSHFSKHDSLKCWFKAVFSYLSSFAAELWQNAVMMDGVIQCSMLWNSILFYFIIYSCSYSFISNILPNNPKGSLSSIHQSENLKRAFEINILHNGSSFLTPPTVCIFERELSLRDLVLFSYW